MQTTYAVLPKAGEAQLRLYNSYNCSINLKTNEGIKSIIGPNNILELKTLSVKNKREIEATMTMSKNNCPYLISDIKWTGSFYLTEKKVNI